MPVLLLQAGLLALKEFPALIDLLNTMKQNGQTAPTQQQLDGLAQAHKDRTGEDLVWDSFIPTA